MTEIEYYLDKARRGETDVAFHGLLELRGDPVPGLEKAFLVESDPEVREMIVGVISPWGRPGIIEFLGAALDDTHPEVWKCALDGLVSNASPISLRVVEQAMKEAASDDPERLAWFTEAIGQINETLARKPWGT
jgi:HEAT repeats